MRNAPTFYGTQNITVGFHLLVQKIENKIELIDRDAILSKVPERFAYNQHYCSFMIYALFDEDKKIMYIGVTRNPRDRFLGHRCSTRGFQYAAFEEVSAYSTCTEMSLLEKQLIERYSLNLINKKTNPNYSMRRKCFLVAPTR